MKDFGNRVTRTWGLGVSPGCAKMSQLTVRIVREREIGSEGEVWGASIRRHISKGGFSWWVLPVNGNLSQRSFHRGDVSRQKKLSSAETFVIWEGHQLMPENIP